MILYINSCVREHSRTHRLAEHLLDRLSRKDQVTEIKLDGEWLAPLDEELLTYRDQKISAGDFDDPIFDQAKHFAKADTIVISAPYWDNSFPALLKIYIENICVTGLTFRYNENGMPVGLCKGKKLYYVVTSGGPHCSAFGYDYIKTLAQMMFGIPETELIMAENLDIIGNDVEAILAEAFETIDQMTDD